MSEQATERTHVDAPPEAVFAAAADFERYPEWAADVKAVQVLARDDDGRPTEVEFRAAAMGRSMTYTLAYDYREAPAAFSWRLVRGDLVRRLEGTYRFDLDDGGTRVTYELAVDLAIPLPGLVKRRAQSLIVGTALKRLKRHVESASTT